MGVEYVSLESLYAQSDVITLHTFLNDSTYHMINTEAIQQMKPGVVIINCARGALIDTRALIDGIESGRVGSVGVDCFEGEDNVIRVDHNYNSRVTNHDYIILKSFQNTIVTPHVAFFTDQAVFDMVQCSLESLHQFELGEKVPLEVHSATCRGFTPSAQNTAKAVNARIPACVRPSVCT
ncbi:MAG: NAD(P)-dependent oxidoreductase [Butyricicoccus sp.]